MLACVTALGYTEGTMNKRDTPRKLVAGPGGYNCPCCRPCSKAEAKKLGARMQRRKLRAKLRAGGEV